MKTVRTLLLTLLLLCQGAFAAELKLYDHMHFKNKPASEKLGCVPSYWSYQWQLHGGGQIPNSELDFSKPAGKYYVEFAQRMRDEGKTTVCLNLEAWNFNLRLGPVIAEKRMRNRLATLALFRAAAPSVQWMVFNWTVDDQSQNWMMAIDRMTIRRWWEWQQWNEKYALPVLRAQEAIFPCCYLRHNYNDKMWQNTKGCVILECQRLVPDKPIYPVLRFRYSVGDGPMSKGKGPHLWIPPEQMRMALTYLKDLGVNGFMLWSPGWQHAQVEWETPELQALWDVIREVVGRDR